MDGRDASHSTRTGGARLRICARRGCDSAVKKPTAKYCSIQCCTLDPERHARLRTQARRHARSTLVPMSRQLAMPFNGTSLDPEAMIARLCEGRDDVPGGLSRLIG